MSSDSTDSIQEAVSERFKSLGFEAGEALHEFDPKFTMEDLQKSLFGSTYSRPHTLPVDLEDCDVHLQVVVTMAKQIYTENTYLRTDSPLGCFDKPEWYIEGWLVKSGFDPYGEVVRVRALIEVSSDGSWDVSHIQRIPSTPNPGGRIVTAI